MISEPKTTCIIPFWNEGRNIFVVLDEITKVRNLDEIICVDDASNDSNHRIIPFKYPSVKVMRLERNLGKSGAVKEGVINASHENILLLDADLRNLNHLEIENAIDAFNSNDDLDMLILRRINAVFIIKMYRADILFSGERILKKADLLEILLSSEITGWQLESAINNWMYTNDSKVAWIAHSAINRHKYTKWGVLRGFQLDIKTYSDMITAAGINNVLRQVKYFARTELKHNEAEVSSRRPELEEANYSN